MMKIPLSPRLRACCNFITPGDRVADVGTDHGYLGIWLLQQGIADSIIASDIVPGPLSAAKANAEKFGFVDRMRFFLSDGVQSIPRDFDVLVCAGMGAETMISILSAADWLRSSEYRLVLQCQTKTHLLRRYLSENGWYISRETVLRDGKFLYTVMEALYCPGNILTPGEWFFPPALMKDSSSELPEYFRWITGTLKKIVGSRGTHAQGELVTALSQLEDDPRLQWLKEEHNDNR